MSRTLDLDTVVVNCGSTSLKLAVFRQGDPHQKVWSATLSFDANVSTTADPRADHAGVTEIEVALRSSPIDWGRVGLIGHRIVHGGERLTEPVRIDAAVEAEIERLVPLAPLHNRLGLAGIGAARRVAADAVQVAVFDSAFHHTLKPAAYAYGGPRAWLDRGLRRYGFHGISHQHAASTASQLLGRPVADLAIVSCHLGGGCSLAAIDGGRSVDTTMGLTPLDGLVMGTRSGSVDPALVLSLIREGASVDEVEHLLEHGSGLAGLSGVSADLRDLTKARDAGDANARLAIDVFVHRVSTGMGAMVAALGRLDAVVFTGGIGEHSAEVRERAARWLEPFGVVIDVARNRESSGDTIVSTDASRIAVAVVEAREDAAIARSAADLFESANDLRISSER